jgi:hypothetical protein
VKRVTFAASLVLVVSVVTGLAQGLKPRMYFDELSLRLRSVKSLSSHDRGWGGDNKFYKLSKEFLRFRTPEDFRKMLNDRNPIVKAMGLLCLAQSDPDENHMILLSHVGDKEEVLIHHGCVVSMITIGEFTRRLLNNPYFLDPDGQPDMMRELPQP